MKPPRRQEHWFVPAIRCTGNPVSIKVGRVRRPPPPDTASMIPAKKKDMLIITNVDKCSSIGASQ